MVGYSTPQPQRDSRQSAATNSGAAARADAILTPIEWRSADNHGGRDARGAAARADAIFTRNEWRSADVDAISTPEQLVAFLVENPFVVQAIVVALEDAGYSKNAKIAAESVRLARILGQEKADLAKHYGPDAHVTVSPAKQLLTHVERTLELIQNMLSQAGAVDDRRQFEQCFPNVAQEIKLMSTEVASQKAHVCDGQSAPRSRFDSICGSAIRLSISTFAGAALGGPAIGFALGESVVDKVVEGALGGLAGGIANEVGLELTSRAYPTPVPAAIPSAVDPPTGERAVAWDATVVHSQPVIPQPGVPGDGLLGLSRVDGRRDSSPPFDHPGARAPRPEARGFGEAPRP